MKIHKIIPALFISQIFCLFLPQTMFSQTEKFDIIQFTPPKGWTRTPRDRALVFTDANKSTGALCILTVYGSNPSSDSPGKDFSDQWNELVVKKFKAQPDPKTESKDSGDGWQATVGGSQVESDGAKLIAILAVYSGFGKTVSMLAIFNDQSYLPQIDAFRQGIKLDKTAENTAGKLEPSPSSAYLDFDPFPDKPHFQAQEPLTGRLRKTITVADLAGTWEIGGASVMEYISSSTQSQTSSSFGRTKYIIRADGNYQASFQGRASNTTIRESESGTFILSGGSIIKRSSNNREMKYQFVAFMAQPNGAAILSLIFIGENAPFDAEGLRAQCGHAHGYITCLNSEEWVRIPLQGR